MLNVEVISGDVAAIRADALITAINSGDTWHGAIDRVIERQAGSMFHDQAEECRPLADGAVIYASANDGRRRAFGAVIFVVDDGEQPLRAIVLAGLREAENRRKTVVTLPLLRTGVMASQFETLRDALNEMAAAIKQFQASQPQYVRQLYIVAYNDKPSQDYLTQQLAAI